MKKTILSLSACLSFLVGTAQTQIFFEDFESGVGGFTLNTADEGGVSGTGGDNYWVVNNSYTGGTGTIQYCFIAMGSSFTVGNTDPQPAGISSQNGNYLHILTEEADANGITNSNYGVAENTFCIFTASHFASMTNDINTTNFNNVTLDFWWLNEADPAAVGEVWYSTDGGTTWTQKTGTTYQGVSTWTSETLTDPAWDGQATLRFGFRFNNGAATAGSDPAFSIDDVEISGTTVSPCSPTSSSFTENACFSYTVPSGDETYTAAGTQTVMDTILNAAGCDSVMTIDLTITVTDTSVSVAPDNLVANSTSGTFDWLDCDNAYASTGNTSDTQTGDGTFAVEVTENGCVDTSSCYTITAMSLEENEANQLRLFPNPSSGCFSIDISKFNGLQQVLILDTKGAVIYSKTSPSGSVIDIDLTAEKGLYIVQLKNQDGTIVRSKLIIQ